jgi:hypothetical protein
LYIICQNGSYHIGIFAQAVVHTQTTSNLILSFLKSFSSFKFTDSSSLQSEIKTKLQKSSSVLKFLNQSFIASFRFVPCFETLFSSTEESIVTNRSASEVNGKTL